MDSDLRSVEKKDGSRSERFKNIRILRIQIHNTAIKKGQVDNHAGKKIILGWETIVNNNMVGRLV
jgi:hypothetical protein